MQRTLLLTTAALMIAGAASAQNPPAQSGPNNNAINSDQKNSDKPVAGRNSFTEGQAKSKIEASGYTNVSGLKKDDNGVWTGTATKGSQKVNVKLDFQGNVVTQ